MPVNDDSGAPSAATSDQPSKTPWRARPSVWSLKRRARSAPDVERILDEEDNEGTRLPESETLHVGGLVLAEVFPPSAVAGLYRALERQKTDDDRAHIPLTYLERSRSGKSGGGWQRLGVVLPDDKRGPFVGLNAIYDGSLPKGVEAVWLDVQYLASSLAVVVATFSYSEETGDLSDLMRADYHTAYFNPRLQVWGRFGALRAHIPWARPKSYWSRSSRRSAAEQKRLAVERRIRDVERKCDVWFSKEFTGRFARVSEDERPMIRVLLTSETDPLSADGRWPGPAGLSDGHPIWLSTRPHAWRLSEGLWFTHPGEQGRDHLMTLFGRRSDIAANDRNGSGTTTNWALLAGLSQDFSGFAAFDALRALLSVYAEGLSALRDSAGRRTLIGRPVSEARNLDDYLIRDGLDAATVVADVEALTADLRYFRFGIAEFVEDDRRWEIHDRSPREYVPELHAELKERARQLTINTSVVTGNIQASAQLRQAITNTKLQRLTLGISFVATALAVVSLVVAHNS